MKGIDNDTVNEYLDKPPHWLVANGISLIFGFILLFSVVSTFIEISESSPLVIDLDFQDRSTNSSELIPGSIALNRKIQTQLEDLGSLILTLEDGQEVITKVKNYSGLLEEVLTVEVELGIPRRLTETEMATGKLKVDLVYQTSLFSSIIEKL